MRVARGSPASLCLVSAGAAGRSGARDGGRAPLYRVGLGFLAVAVDLGLEACVWSLVAIGEMPMRSLLLVLLPSASGPCLLISGELSRWKLGGVAATVERPSNNGSSGHLLVLWCGDADLPLTGHGGEGRDWCRYFCCRYGGGVVGFVLLEFPSRSGSTVEKMKQSGMLQRMEATVCIVHSATSSIRFVYRKLSGGSVDLGFSFAARLGDEGRGESRMCALLLLDLHQGSSCASPGSFLTATNLSSLFKMVERRPLPPSTSATVVSGRRHKDIFNLQASMPLRRPFSCGAVCSRLPVPSGVVPGDVEVDCPELRICRTGDGEGAGPNCVPLFFFRVLDAFCKGLNVIFIFLVALSVFCTSAD